jgi:hypothetical protein
MTTNSHVFTGMDGSSAVMAVTLLRDGGYSGPFQLSAYFELRGRCKMQKDERDLLEVLKCELQFLEDGGYGRPPRTPWRPQYIFEDSPTCMNYDSKENPGPCSDCVLMQLVPAGRRSEKIPCRHIPLNVSGETLDSLYRCSDQKEIEEIVGGWLRTIIRRFEEERLAARQAHSKQPTPSRETSGGTPLYHKQHPKCANPVCPTAFHWTSGGKFFRFRPDPTSANESNSQTDSPGGIHGMRHYWVCERCSHVFTLVYAEGCGVVLKLLWQELSVPEAHKELSAA